jgi:AraC-like DNA-binding protein
MAKPVPRSERRFYAEDRAIGRFGMRIFEPQLMPRPHWHGHIEVNILSGGSMTYRIEGEAIEVPPNRPVLFWANLPHQLVTLTPEGEGPLRLSNIYIPLDRFLFMPHIARLQGALLAGGLVALEPARLSDSQVAAWYRDYRSGTPERREILFMEMNALFRRALLDDLVYLRTPMAEPEEGRTPQSTRIRHVVAMLRFIMENLSAPMTNADVARVTGLHENYALSLFTSVMHVPMRKFIIRMRLLRAQALLLESNATVATVALQSGFPSISQFYDHFGRAYGATPQALRDQRA